MTADYETMTLSREGRLVRMELTRPERLNAFAMTGTRELLDAANRLAADEDVRMVAIAGSGRAFSTGIDLKDLAAGEIEPSYFDMWDRALRVFETMDKLVLCLIHGYAVGGGLQLALACDIRVCTPSAQLGLPAIKEGLIPGLGTFRLARYIGLGRAKSLIIRGNMIDGTEAERIGMVDHLVAEDTALEEFDALVSEYAATNSAGVPGVEADAARLLRSRLGGLLPQVPGAAEQGHGRARLRRGHGGLPGRPRPALGVSARPHQLAPLPSLLARICLAKRRAAAKAP